MSTAAPITVSLDLTASPSSTLVVVPTPVPPVPPVPPSFPTPTDSNANNNANNQQSLATSSQLYLYTFLATLVLLLLVTTGIVIRSLTVRRRQRRLVEEAIRNGAWPPPQPFAVRGSRRGLGEKPRLFVATLAQKFMGSDAAAHDDDSAKRSEKWRDAKGVWRDILPVSVNYIARPKSEDTSEQLTPSRTPFPASSTVPQIQTPARHPLQRYLGLSMSASTASHTTLPPPTEPQPQTRMQIPTPGSPMTMQVVVLVAMPTQRVQHSRSSHFGAHINEEEELPYVEFGAVRVDVGEQKEKGRRTSEEDEGEESEDGTGYVMPVQTMS